MNMPLFPSPAQELSHRHQELQALKTLIQQGQRNSKQRQLIQQAQAWGWQIHNSGGRHPVKAVRPGYRPVVIPGHGSGGSVKRGLAQQILQSLAAPRLAELQAQISTLEQLQAQQQLGTLETQIRSQSQQISHLETQIKSLKIDVETSLSLAATLEQHNTTLARQITALLQDRLELELQRRKIGDLIQQRQHIEHKFETFVADFERLELTLDRVFLYAHNLPSEFAQPLLGILNTAMGD